MKLKKGFTLIEMVVVLAILGALLTMAVPLAQLTSQRAREAELRQSLRSIRTALDEYRKASQRGGSVAQKAGSNGYPRTLEALTEGVRDPSTPEIKARYFLRRLPRDPFADPELPAAQTWGLRCYDSPPNAPAPGDDVFDVYSLSPRQAIDGSWYKDW